MWPNNRQYSHRASDGYLFMTVCEPFTNIAFSPYGRRTSFRVKQLGDSFRFVIVYPRVSFSGGKQERSYLQILRIQNWSAPFAS
jgi:hypothetical protein